MYYPINQMRGPPLGTTSLGQTVCTVKLECKDTAEPRTPQLNVFYVENVPLGLIKSGHRVTFSLLVFQDECGFAIMS